MSQGFIQKRLVEIGVALCFVIVGVLVVVDSLRIGYRWANDGPEPGYFIFYIGCLLILGGLLVVAQTLKNWKAADALASFATFGEFKLMLLMLIPTCVYVLGVIFLGIYLASSVFVAAFMMWQGKFSLFKSAIIGLSLSAILFALFEIWFLISLPKGPIEAWLGY
ncbi:MAG: tripartite tricarboxylate transporter TctB family protein [Burkholderiales bacterium]|nr:tripartite tricarboxylate transporter TctB family protein [Burkholderiales bacterium]